MRIHTGFETWSELDLLTGVILGEARGEPHDGKVGVGIVVRNRVEQPCWWGRNWREVILRESQFSCWEDHNVDEVLEEKCGQTALWLDARKIATDVYLGHVVDRIGGPTHYHADYAHPAWARKLIRLCQIGGHVFYR